MSELDTVTISKETGAPREGSHLFGVSVRGWIAVLVVGTVCVNQVGVMLTACYFALVKQDLSLLGSQTSVTEPLYSLCTMAVGFYFGKTTSK